MGNNAIVGLCYICDNHDWATRFNWLESNRYILKFHCFNAYTKYGNEYSCYSKIFQLKKEFRELSKSEAILETSKKMFLPILYTVLTTICAFLSLIFSGIKPIIDFGWMMTMGLNSFIFVTFLLLPSLLNLFSSNEDIDIKDTEKSKITSALGNFAKKSKIINFWFNNNNT